MKLEKKYYELKTWKLKVWGEYTSEKRAIRSLANRYMQCSKCDAISVPLLLSGKNEKSLSLEEQQNLIDNVGKGVFLFTHETVRGINQLVEIAQISIHPFTRKHWWDIDDINKDLVLPTKFRYEIITGEL